MVNNVDSLTDIKTLSDEGIVLRFEEIIDMWSLLRIKDYQLFQRFRSKWFKEVDTNSRYFHASLKSRGRRKAIVDEKFGEDWIERISEIRQEGMRHFTDIFKEPIVDRLCLDNVVHPLYFLVLLVPFSLQELDCHV